VDEEAYPFMVRLFFSILVADLYYFLFFAVTMPYWAVKFLTSLKYRFGFFQRLGFVKPRTGDTRCVWIHGVSVGEVLAARELIRLVREGNPDLDIVISVTTKTGYEVARRTYGDDVEHIFFFPMDQSPFITRTFARIRPDLVVMVELELWPNFFLHARRLSIPVVFVNGRITARSYEGYRIIGWLLRQVLPCVEIVSVQHQDYAERLVLLGARHDRVKILGNIKYDNIPIGPDEALVARMSRELGIAPEDRPFIGGSIHPGEDEMLLRLYRELKVEFPELRLILVPRHPEQFDRAERLARSAGEEVVRRTTLQEGAPQKERPVILLDTVGELSAAYSLAVVIFVGGSLVPHGGQNMLEPAGLGKPVLFGPYTHNFRHDVELLLGAGAAIEVPSAEALGQQLRRLLEHPHEAELLGRKAQEFIAEHHGASQRNYELLDEVFFKGWRGGNGDR
jgi:3-deoxy-D-manno-octulosonic-acid transferase